MVKFKSLEDYEKGTLPYRDEYLKWKILVKKRWIKEAKQIAKRDAKNIIRGREL